MKKTMFAVLFLIVMFVTNVSAQESTHPSDPATETAVSNNTDAILNLGGQMNQLKAQIAEVEKKCQSATGSAKRSAEKKLDELKKELDELKKSAHCEQYTDPEAQKLCLNLTSEGTNQRLIEAYEKTLERPEQQPASVVENADGSKATTYFPSNAGGGDVGGSETITIADGPNGSYKQVKRVRYQPIPTQFPSVEKGDDGGVHPIVKWLVPVATGALAGAGIAGMADPDGPDGDNYSFGSAGKGAMLGAAAGLAVSLIWEIAD